MLVSRVFKSESQRSLKVCEQLVVIFPAPKYIIRTKKLDNWQNTHTGSLTHMMRAIMVIVVEWKPFELPTKTE